MVSAKDVQGVMAMMPSFSTKNAGDLTSKNTVDVDNLKAGVDRMINDGVDVITTPEVSASVTTSIGTNTRLWQWRLSTR